MTKEATEKDNENSGKELKSFLLYFILIFLIGNIAIGFFEAFNYHVLYPFLWKHNSLRIYTILEFCNFFIGISYTIFSFIALYKTTTSFSHQAMIKMLFISYFVLTVYIITFFQKCSPISYLIDYFYNIIK